MCKHPIKIHERVLINFINDIESLSNKQYCIDCFINKRIEFHSFCSFKFLVTCGINEQDAKIIAKKTIDESDSEVYYIIEEESKEDRLTIKDVSKLYQKYAKLENEKLIDLQNQSIEIECLIKILETNKVLKELNLERTNIRSGIQELSEYLIHNNTIQVIDLGDNNLGKDSLYYLCNIVKNNNTIKSIKLMNNSFLYSHVVNFFEYFKFNNTITCLEIWSTNDRLTEIIDKVLKRNFEYEKQRKMLLLFMRESGNQYPFHKDYFPLDLFKMFFFSI